MKLNLKKNWRFYVGVLVSILFFILGLFDLQETRWGYTSDYIVMAIVILLFSYLYDKIRIKENETR